MRKCRLGRVPVASYRLPHLISSGRIAHHSRSRAQLEKTNADGRRWTQIDAEDFGSFVIQHSPHQIECGLRRAPTNLVAVTDEAYEHRARLAANVGGEPHRSDRLV